VEALGTVWGGIGWLSTARRGLSRAGVLAGPVAGAELLVEGGLVLRSEDGGDLLVEGRAVHL